MNLLNNGEGSREWLNIRPLTVVSLQASLQNLNIFIKFEYLGIPTLVDFIEITYLGVCHFLTVLMKNYFPELTVIATSHWGCGNRLMKKWVTIRKVIMKPKQIFKVHN